MSAGWGIALVAGALVVSALGGWLVTGLVLRAADRRSRGAETRRAAAVLRGGTWIGILERVAVTGTILAGEAGGVAVVVAVKGLGRYPELRNGDDPAVSERFVIGTLASLVWSAAAGVLGRWLLTR